MDNHHMGARRRRKEELYANVRRAVGGAMTAALLATSLPVTAVTAVAAPANFQGSLTSVTSVEPSGDNQVNITFDAGPSRVA